MRKIFFMLTVAAMMLSACQNVTTTMVDENENENTEQQLQKMFTFHVKGAFSQSQEEMSRASVRLEDNNSAGITDLWVLDYSPTPSLPEGEGVLLQTVHQKVGDSDFGHPQMALTYGHHDIKFIASKGDTPALSESALSWQKVKDTFVLDYPVDVVASSNGNRAPELKRAVSGVRLVMTDKIPTGATKVEVVLSDRYSSLALPSLAVGGLGEFTNTFEFAASDAGYSINLNTYTLAPEEVWQTDVTVRAYKGSVKVTEFTIEDVELKRNRMTELKGELWDRSSGFSVSVDDEWEESSTVEF